jgi:hypothetical protein
LNILMMASTIAHVIAAMRRLVARRSSASLAFNGYARLIMSETAMRDAS